MSGCMILYFLFSFFQNKYFIHLLSNRTKNYNSAYNSTLCKIDTLTLVIKRNGRNCNVRQNEQQTKKTSRPQNVILLLVQQHRTDAFPLKFILLAVLVCFSKYFTCSRCFSRSRCFSLLPLDSLSCITWYIVAWSFAEWESRSTCFRTVDVSNEKKKMSQNHFHFEIRSLQVWIEVVIIIIFYR